MEFAAFPVEKAASKGHMFVCYNKRHFPRKCFICNSHFSGVWLIENVYLPPKGEKDFP